MTKSVPHERVRAQIESILRAWGMPEDMIATTADVMVETDLWGVDSHGVSMLMMYEDMFREGRLQIAARPTIVRETAATAVVDGGAGLGHPVSVFGMELAVKKARDAGVGIVTVNNSHHFGAAGVYAKIAADKGLLGIALTTARGVTVVPTGARQAVLGTNPIAFAAPAKRNPPFVLDMATSAVAVGKVKVYSFYEKPIPSGWVMDGEGRPMTDSTAAFDVLWKAKPGGLAPVGGTRELGSHKGYGLGMMVQILSGTLAGGSFSPLRNKTLKPTDPYNIGHFFLAIEPTFFRAEGDFEAEMDDLIDYLHAMPAADAEKPVLVAGDPEQANKANRLKDGIPIPDQLGQQIKAITERASVPFLL